MAERRDSGFTATGNPTVLIEVDDQTAARTVLAGRVSHFEVEGGGLRLTLGDDVTAAQINAALVGAGVAVSRLEPARATLEQTFLAITSRLESNE